MADTAIPISEWLEGALADPDFCGIEFYETIEAPKDEKGRRLLEASCRVLDRLRYEIAKRKLSNDTLPYVKFSLEHSDALRAWNDEIWDEIRGDRACIEISKDGAAFYWGVWESHHETVLIPVNGCQAYTAIFRRWKGFYDGEPWDQYNNELFLFAPAE